MTPEELLRIARNINPEKLESDPQAALEDAYIVWEAVRLAEREKLSGEPTTALQRMQAVLRHSSPKPQKKDPTLNTIDHLRLYLDKEGISPNALAKKLKMNSSTLYHWLSSTHKPQADGIAKIEGFLTDVGYYE